MESLDFPSDTYDNDGNFVMVDFEENLEVKLEYDEHEDSEEHSKEE